LVSVPLLFLPEYNPAHKVIEELVTPLLVMTSSEIYICPLSLSNDGIIMLKKQREEKQ